PEQSWRRSAMRKSMAQSTTRICQSAYRRPCIKKRPRENPLFAHQEVFMFSSPATLYLLIAIVFEVVATSALKASGDGSGMHAIPYGLCCCSCSVADWGTGAASV